MLTCVESDLATVVTGFSFKCGMCTLRHFYFGFLKWKALHISITISNY